MQPPLVSCVLTVSNPKRITLARKAVNNFLRQHYVPFELFIVNGTDIPVLTNPENVGRLLNGKQNTYEIMTRPGLNSAQMKNEGLNASQGAWAICVDDDDFFHPARLTYQMARRREGVPCMLKYQLRIDITPALTFGNPDVQLNSFQPYMRLIGMPGGIPSTMLFPTRNSKGERWFFDARLNIGEYDELLARMGNDLGHTDFLVCDNSHNDLLNALHWPLLSIAVYHGSNELTKEAFFQTTALQFSSDSVPAGMNSHDVELLRTVLQSFNLQTQ